MAQCNNVGGYDYQFVSEPSDMLVCKICHLPSQDPHLSMCCGHTFCKSCLDIAKEVTFSQMSDQHCICSVCPMCRSEEFLLFQTNKYTGKS